ncbi:hypothetical protein ATCC90586_002169 [Pythium insidiosum]|nr:hypothetical protein ATCC90586_002169 [Pythium insidiosum]
MQSALSAKSGRERNSVSSPSSGRVDLSKATGFATRDLQPYATVEPDTVIFGPYAYRGIHLDMKNASASQTRPLWAYKYDTLMAIARPSQ